MIVVEIILGVLSSLGLYYFMLPPMNLTSEMFYLYWFCVSVIFIIIGFSVFDSDDNKTSGVGKVIMGVFSGILGLCVVFFVIGGLISCPLFRASDYAQIISNNITRKDISEYTPTIDDVPLMDKDTAELLASRTMGSLVNEVSQYTLGSSTQINYRNEPYRVVPLEYDGFFKWLNNKSVGIPSYITVNMETQKTDIHTLEKGIRFSPSGCFNDDLRRLLRFKYPTLLLDSPVFEIDEEGRPFWVVSILEHKIGLFGGTDVRGILMVDAITGDIERYDIDDIPSYIDNAYSTDILINLYDYYGQYQDGFWNSIFGQKGVVKATEGYNYIPQNDDIYVYTGVTSVVSDESNIGFIFVNKRTKEYEYYEVAGAEEFSAMASAEGVVQHLGYTSTFPLLLQIEGQPTYCVALKDAGGLVKMYGLINMSQYQIVVTGDTIVSCLSKYRTALLNNGQSVLEVSSSTIEGIVEDIRTANKEGTTYFYIKFIDNPIYYSFNVIENEEIILVNIEDNLKFSVEDGVEGNIIRANLVS